MPEHTNLLLASLSKPDFGLLEPYLRPIEFQQHETLFEAGDNLSTVYFPFNAVVSLMATLSSGEMVEAAMVGRDGVVGAAAALDGKIALSRGVVQIKGRGVTCEVNALQRAAMQSTALHSVLMRHEQTLYAQVQQTAACNLTHIIEERLARWLLRARDLCQSDTLPFTQDFLGEMLGARRSSVSVVAHTLQTAGLIKYVRGRIHIENVEGLRESSCECYASVSDSYTKLLGFILDKKN